jgi:hypothetical protein
MRRPSNPAEQRPERAKHARRLDTPDTDTTDQEARRQRWIAETTAAFVSSGTVDQDPVVTERRRAFRRAALTDEQVPSRRDRWASELTSAFGPTAS